MVLSSVQFNKQYWVFNSINGKTECGTIFPLLLQTLRATLAVQRLFCEVYMGSVFHGFITNPVTISFIFHVKKWGMDKFTDLHLYTSSYKGDTCCSQASEWFVNFSGPYHRRELITVMSPSEATPGQCSQGEKVVSLQGGGLSLPRWVFYWSRFMILY